MNSAPTATHVETEFKFRVPMDFELPSFPKSLGTWTIESVRDMDARYWDTTDATLLRWGITMRIRTGGGDDGWHLKIPTSPANKTNGASVRTELHRDASSTTPPIEFLELLSVILQGSQVVPIARVQTQRKPRTLSDSRGAAIEVVDDLVTLSRGDQIVDTFREIEIELMNDKALPEALVICEILLNAGAQTSTVSKAANAFGAAAKKQPDIPQLPMPDKGDLACDLIRWAIARQVRKIFHAELGSRMTHETRSLTHELVGLVDLLKALKNWLNEEEQEFLREDLAWLIRELSIAAELTRQHEQALVVLDSLSDPLDRHVGATAIDQYFASKREAARSSLQAARRSDRYLFLFNDLINLARVPAVTPEAYEPNSIWDNISQDPCDQLAIAEHFAGIFKKKSKQKQKNLTCSKGLTGPIDVRELIRAIALSGKSDPAGIFALGLALSRKPKA